MTKIYTINLSYISNSYKSKIFKHSTEIYSFKCENMAFKSLFFKSSFYRAVVRFIIYNDSDSDMSVYGVLKYTFEMYLLPVIFSYAKQP